MRLSGSGPDVLGEREIMYRYTIDYDKRDFIRFTRVVIRNQFGVLLVFIDILLAVPVLSVFFAVSGALRTGEISFGLIVGLFLVLLYAFWLFGFNTFLGIRSFKRYQETYGTTLIEFGETSVCCKTTKNAEEIYAYNAFVSFVCSGDDCYLFLNKSSGYIIPGRVTGSEHEAFKRFVEEKTGLTAKK